MKNRMERKLKLKDWIRAILSLIVGGTIIYLILMGALMVGLAIFVAYIFILAIFDGE